MSAAFKLTIEESPGEAGGSPDRIIAGRWEGRTGSRAVQMLTLLNALFDAWDGAVPAAHAEGRRRAADRTTTIPDADV